MATKKRNVIKTNVKNLVEEVKGKKKLGYILWWTISQNLLIDGEKAQDIFTKKGFDKKELPLPLEADVAFVRSARKINTRNSDWLIRKVLLNDDKIIYSLVKETIDKIAEDSNYIKEDKITLLRATKDVTMENNLDISKEIKSTYQNLVNKIDNWRFTEFLLRQLKNMNSIQLREMGGIYFVPIINEEKLNLIEEGLNEISPESVFYLLPIYDEPKTKNNLQNAFQEDFKKEIETMADELEKRIEADNTRPGTFQNRLQEYKEFRERAKAYEDLLSFKASDIHKTIDKLEFKVKEALGK